MSAEFHAPADLFLGKHPRSPYFTCLLIDWVNPTDDLDAIAKEKDHFICWESKLDRGSHSLIIILNYTGSVICSLGPFKFCITRNFPNIHHSTHLIFTQPTGPLVYFGVPRYYV